MSIATARVLESLVRAAKAVIRKHVLVDHGPPVEQGPFESAKYWESRYRSGGTSGPGSYARLAAYKANFLNAFVALHSVRSVIEFGSGDGAQLALSSYPEYVGIDVSMTAIEKCRKRFAGDPSKRFLLASEVPEGTVAELGLSLDVVFHLVEDDVFVSYMTDLFKASTRFVIVYSSDRDEDWPARHVRHREFTRWVRENRPDWRLVGKDNNPFPFDESDPDGTSFADFHVYARGSDLDGPLP